MSSPYVAMRYDSTATLAELLQQHTSALFPLHCTTDGGLRVLGGVAEHSVNCSHDDVAAVSISIEGRLDGKGTGCRKVTLYFVENY